MTNFENLSANQKLRAILHRDTKLICNETCHFLGLEMTRPAMEVIAELVYKKLAVYATDLEAFAKHAKRQTINSEDVKLLVRRNPSLVKHISKLVPTNPTIAKEKRRKTVALPVARQPETPTPTKINIEEPQKENVEILENSPVVQDSPKGADVPEMMVLDNTIDLTFD